MSSSHGAVGRLIEEGIQVQRPNIFSILAGVRGKLLVIVVGIAAVAVTVAAGFFAVSQFDGSHNHNDGFVSQNRFQLPGTGGPGRVAPKRGGPVRTGYPGVNVQVQNGALVVTGVASGSPADSAGVKTGDTILQVDGKNVTDPQTLRSAIASVQPGSSYKLQIRRSGQDQTLTVPAPRRASSGALRLGPVARNPSSHITRRSAISRKRCLRSS
jgi:S1-C subfamily serine protease